MVSNFDLNRTALNNQMMGLSTDTKPTNGIIPNSLFWELDTNGMYYFDGTQWQSIGGSGGGGGDDGLVELEYTVSESYVTITKTPGEIKTLIDAGKSFKIICNDDLASAISANEGDIYVAFEYDLYGSNLLNLDFARTSTPLFTLSSGAFKTLPFSVEEGDLLQVIL